jgi:hypothetical protein
MIEGNVFIGIERFHFFSYWLKHSPVRRIVEFFLLISCKTGFQIGIKVSIT